MSRKWRSWVLELDTLIICLLFSFLFIKKRMKAGRTSGLALCGWSRGWDRKLLTLLIPFVASSGSPAALTFVDVDLDVEGLLVWTMWQQSLFRRHTNEWLGTGY